MFFLRRVYVGARKRAHALGWSVSALQYCSGERLRGKQKLLIAPAKPIAIFKFGLLVVAVGGLAGCATPAPVKQAIKNQSDAYTLLDRSLQDFGTSIRGLRRDLAAVNEARRIRACATQAITKEVVPGLRCGTGKSADSQFKTSSELTEYTITIGQIDAAIRAPDGTNPDPLGDRIKARYDAFSIEQTNLRNQIKALGIINSTIADYYNIDLSPGPDATKALIESIKPLAQ
jgi:hypothetical protein